MQSKNKKPYEKNYYNKVKYNFYFNLTPSLLWLQ